MDIVLLVKAAIMGVVEGLTEFMCHPGYCTAELRAARTRLKESRERELEALVSSPVKKALHTARSLGSENGSIGKMRGAPHIRVGLTRLRLSTILSTRPST